MKSSEPRSTTTSDLDQVCIDTIRTLSIPAHVLTAALYERFASRDEDEFQNRLLSAMRFGFGGHVEKE